MIRRTQFLVLRGWDESAIAMFEGILKRMPNRPLYVTVEIEDQYHALRSKLARRAALKRKCRKTS